jgi:hypothetical protein
VYLKNFYIFCNRQKSIKLFYMYRRFQCTDNYFFKKNNFFYFFIYCCQYHERKTICLDIFLLSDRHWGTEHQYLIKYIHKILLFLILFYNMHTYKNPKLLDISPNYIWSISNISIIRLYDCYLVMLIKLSKIVY